MISSKKPDPFFVSLLKIAENVQEALTMQMILELIQLQI